MMIVENKFEIGDTVYLKTDQEQLQRIIVSIKVYKKGELTYEIVSGTVLSSHYDFEISTEKDFVNV